MFARANGVTEVVQDGTAPQAGMEITVTMVNLEILVLLDHRYIFISS